ncbi:Anaphase-promoting complex subunit 10 [Echinococcus granulosus]|uniref:Anaphase-promoting complex subunit 10 n=2 Tax=Echinococcus TaxID=6209 RepID=U6JH36_ECHGR|nr:Anaphase-promoting complex subunit [Echinococcus granulosus]EUB60966.1 Anaphase-promoting complex subunit [Echinococcus granulosus]KAH9284576.1 Anaphase-promoting complex subunit 10 [Echinococcus granulosus]CDI98131.1 anaphase promoting complex subunit 10 [Echinococcus multilocularis]CDS21812.1 anaphase promoting complex subunit 10 [Echinococcus granulosus]
MATTLETVTSADITEKEREGKVCDVSDRAVWCLSSCKSNHGINELLNESLDTYWQSDGPQPHTVTVQFPQKTIISEICLYNDYKVDESYTPSRIAIRVGNHVGDLVELTEVELHEPSGWSVLPLRWPNGAPVSLFTLQLRILANHQNGRDTHLRAIRLFAPLVRSGLDAALNQALFTTLEARRYTTIR